MMASMVSKAAISSTLAILTTCTTELVCAEKKRICGFSTIVYARTWLLCAPFIGATIVFGKLIPQTALASLSIIGGLLSTLISSPRTIQPIVKHSNLPREIYPEIYTIKNFDSLTIGDKLKAWNDKVSMWFSLRYENCLYFHLNSIRISCWIAISYHIF